MKNNIILLNMFQTTQNNFVLKQYETVEIIKTKLSSIL